MSMMKKMIACILTAVMILAGTESIAWASELEPYLFDVNKAEKVVVELFGAADRQDWNRFTELMCSSEQEYYEYYFSNTELQNGIKQVERGILLNTYFVENDLAENEWLVKEYPILSSSKETYSFVAEVDCEVNKENKYFINGINYFLVVLAVENDALKVVQFNRPSMELISTIVEPELSEQSMDYDEQIAGIEVLEYAERGLVVNAEKEILVDGFEVIRSTDKDEAALFSFDIINHYSTYSYPTTIDVLMNDTSNGGDGTIKTVNFTMYMKNTLPNEWMGNWHTESLKAGAYCVKMVGIYRTIKPVNSSGGYDVTQYTQKYIPNTQYNATNTAIDSIKNRGMAVSSGRLFFPEYAAGTKGSAGTRGCGQVKQWGSQLLATQGYSYDYILNYYYKGSSITSEDLNFFGYNIGY